MAQPQVPIVVDDETGVWSVDGVPMILMPRHFFLNVHMTIENAVGEDAYAKMMFVAGHKSAWTWCEREAVTHGLGGADLFRHYMKRLSQRGWGRFEIDALDTTTGMARVSVLNSVFVENSPRAGRKLCFLFCSWLCGSIEYVEHASGNPLTLMATETQCAASGAPHCSFEVTPT